MKLQEDRFKTRPGEFRHGIAGLKEMLTKAENQPGITLRAQAVAEAELASLLKQVEGITTVVEQVRDEAGGARWWQFERS